VLGQRLALKSTEPVKEYKTLGDLIAPGIHREGGPVFRRALEPILVGHLISIR
jgi:hypothetical protein